MSFEFAELKNLESWKMPSDPRQSIVVIGDVMIDRYVTGKVERISPEAPVPVLMAH